MVRGTTQIPGAENIRALDAVNGGIRQRLKGDRPFSAAARG